MIGWLISRLGPTLIPVLVSGGVFFGAGWFAHGVKFDWIDRPAIVREATNRAEDACTIRTQDAAARAEAAERLKQQRANAEALRIYREALTASQRAVEEADTRISQEIAAYENQIALEGRTCRLTQRDLDWLHGSEPTGATGGR